MRARAAGAPVAGKGVERACLRRPAAQALSEPVPVAAAEAAALHRKVGGAARTACDRARGDGEAAERALRRHLLEGSRVGSRIEAPDKRLGSGWRQLQTATQLYGGVVLVVGLVVLLVVGWRAIRARRAPHS